MLAEGAFERRAAIHRFGSIPNIRQNPQFRIRYEKPEVAPPTKGQVENVLATTTGRVKLLCELMRWTTMALADAQKFGMSLEDAQNFGLSKPERRPVLENETRVRRNVAHAHGPIKEATDD